MPHFHFISKLMFPTIYSFLTNAPWGDYWLPLWGWLIAQIAPIFHPSLATQASCPESSPGLLLKGRSWFLHESKMWSTAWWRLSHPGMLTPLLTQWQKLPSWGDSGGRRCSDGCLDLLEAGTQLTAPNVGIKILTLQVQPDPVQEGSLGRDRR